MKEITPTITPTLKQHAAYQFLWDDHTMFLLFGGGAGGGKSFLGCEWIVTNCYRYPGSRWFIGRKELKRLMSSTYITFLKVCAHHKIPQSDWKLNGQYNFIEFTNGSRIDLLDLKYLPSDPLYERFGSLEYTGGWIEEAGEVDFLCFDVLKTRIGRHENVRFGLVPAKLLLTCNPTQNWLYRIFYKPSRAKTLPQEYAFVQSLYRDNPHTAAQYEMQLSSLSDAVLRARLRDGYWEYNADDLTLINYDAITDLFTNVPEPSDHSFFTGDLARYGGDRIVYGGWQGLNLNFIQWKDKQGIDVSATDIRTILVERRIPYSRAIVDEGGVGGGVVDLLKGIKGFVASSAALKRKDPMTKENTVKDNYRNLRSQCSYMMAEKINNHQMAISAAITEQEKEWIIEELQQIKKKPDAPIEAPLQVMAKEEMKESLGRSPDFADMIMMRMYFELDMPTVYKQPTSFGGVNGYWSDMPG